MNGMMASGHSRRMMNGLLALGMAMGLILSPLAAHAQLQPPEHTITTQGHGEVRIQPDSFSVNIAVESRDASLARAREQNNRQMQAIHNALRGLNIPNMQLETQTVQVNPIYESPQPREERTPRITGYRVSNTILVRVTDSQSLGEQATRVIDTALDAGGNNVYGLNFYLDDMAPARAQALQQAVQDARRNAQAMAQAANVTITGIHSMEGAPQYGYPRPMPMMARGGMAAAEMAATPIEVGETTITSDVTVRFQY